MQLNEFTVEALKSLIDHYREEADKHAQRAEESKFAAENFNIMADDLERVLKQSKTKEVQQ